MMVVLRVAALLLLGVVSAFMLWIMFVNLAGRENSRWFGGRPGTLGARDGKLAPPKSTPNSVVSEGIDPAHPAYVAPITYSGDSSVAMARLGGVLQRLGGVTLIRVEPTYLYAECRTKTMRFVDDFEARIDPVAHVIHVRSASRLGRSDLGVNRARVELVRREFVAAAAAAAN